MEAIENESIIFDIETAPMSLDSEMLEIINEEAESGIPSNIKDSEKRQARFEANVEKIKDRLALSPETSFVCAFGIKKGKDTPFVMTTKYESSEKSLLETFWLKATKGQMHLTNKLVGFNSNNFDLPFLIKRSWMLGIEIPQTLITKSRGKFYLSEMCVDILDKWTLGDPQKKISLGKMAKFLGLGEKTESGKDFYKTLCSDKEKAEKYLINDVYLTYLISERLGL